MTTQMQAATLKIENIHKGATQSLYTRATRLHELIYALEQYIYFLRQASQRSLQGHTLSHGILEECLNAQDGPDSLLTDDGLRVLIKQLSLAEDETKAIFTDTNTNQLTFFDCTTRLSEMEIEIESLLAPSLLGKSQHQEETKVNEAASLVEQILANLNIACSPTQANVPSPYMDPFTLHQMASFRLDQFLAQECEFARKCLTAQKVEKTCEETVFDVVKDVTLEHEKVMTPMMERQNEILAGVNATEFHALTDWSVFESKNVDMFVHENAPKLEVTTENHPSEEEFTQFHDITETHLEVYHRLRVSQTDKPDKAMDKVKNVVGKLKRPKHGYAVRGTWSVSAGAYLIEHDSMGNVQSMFNLRKCKLGPLNAHETDGNGYFVIRGRRI